MDLRDEIANAAGVVQTFAEDIYAQHPLALETYVALVLLGGVVFLVHRWRVERRKTFNQQRGEKMTRSERQQYVNIKVADAITDALLDLEIKGQLCTAEVAHYSKKMARAMKLQYELMPRHLHPGEQAATKGVYIKIAHKPNIPGPKPGEDAYVKPVYKQLLGNVSKFLTPKTA